MPRINRTRARPAPVQYVLPGLDHQILGGLAIEEQIRHLSCGSDGEAAMGEWIERAVAFGEEKAAEYLEDEAEAARTETEDSMQAIANVLDYLVLSPIDKKSERAHVLEVMAELSKVTVLMAKRLPYVAALTFEEACDSLDITFPIN